jgi:hypothetical protein
MKQLVDTRSVADLSKFGRRLQLGRPAVFLRAWLRVTFQNTGEAKKANYSSLLSEPLVQTSGVVQGSNVKTCSASSFKNKNLNAVDDRLNSGGREPPQA